MIHHREMQLVFSTGEHYIKCVNIVHEHQTSQDGHDVL